MVAVRTMHPVSDAAIETALVRRGSLAAVDAHALSRAVLELLRLEAASGDLVLVAGWARCADSVGFAALAA